jgi:erythromycin esterase-like protein
MTTLRERARRRGDDISRALIDQLRTIALPLEDAADLDPLLERIGDARYVLLGEASHGTAEYYNWRTRISKRLIQEKGFSFIAVEGDWPDCYRLNRYVKHLRGSDPDARTALEEFRRWPTWMWGNMEVGTLAEGLHHHNDGLPEERRVGFYGLDVYSLWESLEAITEYLERIDPDAAAVARRSYRCFEPYGRDVQEYARATAFTPASCEREVLDLMVELRANAPVYGGASRDDYFNAEQNALVALDAERYYRAMIRGGNETWNIRDRHMVQTLERLMRHHGPDAKAIVWEHNTHIGDAHATDMARAGMVNVGQLVREGHMRAGVVLVGFAGHHGSVIAGREWGAPMERMRVPPAREGSWEDLLHRADERRKLLILDRDALTPEMWDPRGHRAIGVVYDPSFERFGNYVETVLPARYDAFLSFEETRALHPLALPVEDEGEPPETYTWAV